jgi:quercetin dioxygenase-like cupin family protein
MDKQAMTVRRGAPETLSVLGTELRFLCEGGRTGRGFSIMELVLPTDSGPPLHDHPWDEAYYVIEGQVRFTVGDMTEVFDAGDFIYAPGGTPHAFNGVSEAPARLLVLDVPAASEPFFRDVDREVRSIPADLAKLPEIGQRHQLRFHPAPV